MRRCEWGCRGRIVEEKTHRFAYAAEGAGGGVLPEDTREKELSLAERDMRLGCKMLD